MANELVIYQGADWNKILTLYNKSGTPFDLSNYISAEMHIKKTPQDTRPTAIVTTELLTPLTAGRISLALTHTQTSAIPVSAPTVDGFSKYVSDIFLIRNNGNRISAGAFDIKVKPEVTRHE